MERSRQLAEWTLAFVCVAAPLALGSVHLPVILGLAFLLFGAAILIVRQSSLRIPSLTIAFGFLAICSCVQLIPLPSVLLGVISPRALEILHKSETVAGIVGGWHGISLQPDTTGFAAVRFATLALAALVAQNLNGRGETRHLIQTSVLAGALLSLVIGLIQYMSGTPLFYGVYQASISPKISTFVSSNHAASLFGFAGLVSGVFAYRSVMRVQRRRAAVFGGVACALFIAMIESDSVGTVLATLIAGAVFVSLLSVGRWDVMQRQTKFAVGLLMLLAASLALVSVNLDDVLSSLGTRIELVKSAVTGSTDSWMVGFGAGATETCLPAYVDWSNVEEASLLTIETEPAEWLFCVGWPVTLVVLGFLMLGLIPAVPAQRNHRTLACLSVACSAYLLMILMVHFPTYALGLSLPIVVMIESLVSYQWVEGLPWHRRRFVVIEGRLRFLVVFCLGLAIIVGSAAKLSSYRGLSAISHRPADGMIFARLASASLKDGNLQRGMQFARRASELEPTGRMFLLLAEAFAANELGKEAASAYQKVAGFNLEARATISATSRLPPDLAALALPVKTQWAVGYDNILKRRGQRAALDFALALADHNPGQGEASALVVRAYLALGQPGVAQIWARLMMLENQTDAQGRELGASLLVDSVLKSGERERARKLAYDLYEQVPNNVDLQRYVLALLPASPSASDAKIIQAAFMTFCQSAGPADTFICDYAEGWLAINADGGADPLSILNHINDRYGDPIPLATYYVKTNQCASANALLLKNLTNKKIEELRRVTKKCRVLP